MNAKLVGLAMLALGAAIVVGQQQFQIPVWTGQNYVFPKLGPTLSMNNGQLDAVLPAAQPPYIVNGTDVDFGNRTLVAQSLRLTPTAAGMQIRMMAGPAPSTTCDDTGTPKMCWDAVLFFDVADNRLKMLKKTGELALIELTPPAQ